MALPGFVHSLIDKLRGGSFTGMQTKSHTLYNFARAHPLATPPPAELEAMQAQYQQQMAAARAANPSIVPPPFISPATRLIALGLGDDELTRFRLIGIHLWMLSAAMQASVAGPETFHAWGNVTLPPAPTNGAAEADVGRSRLTSQQRSQLTSFFDLLWHEMTPFLMKTRGELRLSSTLREVQEHWYHNFITLDMAWQEARTQPIDGAALSPAAAAQQQRKGRSSPATAGPFTPAVNSAQGMEALVAAMWRLFWLGDTRARKRDVYVLTCYFLLQARQLTQFNSEQLWSGEGIEWRTSSAIVKNNAQGDDMMAAVLRVPKTQWANNDFSGWKTPLVEKLELNFKGN